MQKLYTYSYLSRLARGILTVMLCCCLANTALAADSMSAILYDYDTGKILYEKNADVCHYPASLTKMMTLYLTFDALAMERIGKNSQFPVSYNASIQEPSKLGLLPGQYVRVEDLVLGTATNSSNDAATVLAEGIGGDIYNFSEMMNKEAQQIGMQNSYFENPTGLPNPRQSTTARDMLKLAIALHRNFPQYYSVFSTRNFTYHGRQYKNHNHLLYNYAGTDGIKTGYIHAEGYNLVGSVVRDGRRLLAVVLGAKTYHTRDRFMEWLFDQGFARTPNLSTLIPPAFAEPAAPANMFKAHKKSGKHRKGKVKKAEKGLLHKLHHKVIKHKLGKKKHKKHG